MRTKECLHNPLHVVEVEMPVIQLAGRSTTETICYRPDKRGPPVVQYEDEEKTVTSRLQSFVAPMSLFCDAC